MQEDGDEPEGLLMEGIKVIKHTYEVSMKRHTHGHTETTESDNLRSKHFAHQAHTPTQTHMHPSHDTELMLALWSSGGEQREEDKQISLTETRRPLGQLDVGDPAKSGRLSRRRVTADIDLRQQTG